MCGCWNRCWIRPGTAMEQLMDDHYVDGGFRSNAGITGGGTRGVDGLYPHPRPRAEPAQSPPARRGLAYRQSASRRVETAHGDGRGEGQVHRPGGDRRSGRMLCCANAALQRFLVRGITSAGRCCCGSSWRTLDQTVALRQNRPALRSDRPFGAGSVGRRPAVGPTRTAGRPVRPIRGSLNRLPGLNMRDHSSASRKISSQPLRATTPQ